MYWRICGVRIFGQPQPLLSVNPPVHGVPQLSVAARPHADFATQGTFQFCRDAACIPKTKVIFDALKTPFAPDWRMAATNESIRVTVSSSAATYSWSTTL